MAAAKSEGGRALVPVRRVPARIGRAAVARLLRLSPLEQRLVELLRRDADLVERGVVSFGQLVPPAPSDYAARLPSFLAHEAGLGTRLERGLVRARDASGGALVPRAAALFELGARAVLLGSVDLMRRQGIEPALAAVVGTSGRVLDLDGGVGPVASALRSHGFVPAPGSLDLPLGADFDLVTGSFTLHALDADRRAVALAACFEALRPGGTLVLVECAQHRDAPGLEARLARLEVAEDYLDGDIREKFARAGFEAIQRAPALLATVLTARVPATTVRSSR